MILLYWRSKILLRSNIRVSETGKNPSLFLSISLKLWKFDISDYVCTICYKSLGLRTDSRMIDRLYFIWVKQHFVIVYSRRWYWILFYWHTRNDIHLHIWSKRRPLFLLSSLEELTMFLYRFLVFLQTIWFQKL